MRLRQYFNIILDFDDEMLHKLGISKNWSEGMVTCSVCLWKAGVLLLTRIIYVKSSLCVEKSERKIKF